MAGQVPRLAPGLKARAVALSDPEQGLSADVLDNCDVLMWWGHQKHADIKPETGKKLVARIKAGDFSLIALHSAHFSTPFMEAMFERTRIDTARQFPGGAKEKVEITYVEPPNYRAQPKRNQIVTPYNEVRKFPDGTIKVTTHLPYCCFPAWRADGKPDSIKILKPDHPIAKGLPTNFSIPHTEMYDEPFHVPTPDERILEECWETGEWFPSGSVWHWARAASSTSGRDMRHFRSTGKRRCCDCWRTRPVGWGRRRGEDNPPAPARVDTIKKGKGLSMPAVQVETGDVTLRSPALRRFRLRADRPLTGIDLAFDGEQAHVDAKDWRALLDQVKTRSLSRWKHTRMEAPMGQPDVQALLSLVGNTPAYQLFLAGFDISEAVELVSQLPERVVLRRAIGLSGRLPSITGSGGLFFLPDGLVDDEADAAARGELVLNNKLCSMQLDAGEAMERYYIPYATPIDFTTRVGPQTRALWDRVRDFYYAFR